jgi:hypothetical protein
VVNEGVFCVRLYHKGPEVETTIRELEVTKVSEGAYPHLEKVRFHKEKKVKTVGNTEEDLCYLKIWGTDYFPTLKRERRPHVFDLIATFQGVVVKGSKGKYTFQPTAASAGAANPQLKLSKENDLYGKALLSLFRLGENKPQTFPIPLPRYMAIFYLAAVLRKNREEDFTYREKDPSKLRVLERVKNVEASLKRQIKERGGYAVAFVAKGVGQEFLNQAEESIATLPTFKEDEEEITMGYYEISSWKEINKKLDDLTGKIKKKYSQNPSPKVAMLALYSHGMPYAILNDQDGLRWKSTGSLNLKVRPDDIANFVKNIQGYLSDRVVIPLFACCCGRSRYQPEEELTGGKDGNLKYYPYIRPPVCEKCPNASSCTPRKHCEKGTKADKEGKGWRVGHKGLKVDNKYGKPDPCEELGGDSLAWTLYRQLVKHGIEHPTIWAHTTAQHTTKNCRLRVFSHYGTVDFLNLLARMPSVSDPTVECYTKKTTFADLNHLPADDWENLKPKERDKHKKIYYNSDLIRTISFQDAMYFPWSWNGGQDATKATPGFDEDAQKEVIKVNKELSDGIWSEGVPIRQIEELVYEDKRRAYITGLASKKDPKLSRDFKYSNLNGLASPMRISVQLIKYIQLLVDRTRARLRDRTDFSVMPKKIFENGDGLAIEVSPDTEEKRGLVVKIANNMWHDEGLFRSVEVKDKWVYIIVAASARV